LAIIKRDQGKYAEAEGLQKRALAIHQQAFGANHVVGAYYLNNLGTILRLQGKYAEAEELHRRALANYEQAVGPNEPHVAEPLNELALVIQAQGRYAEAEGLYQRALAIQEQALGSKHPKVAATLNNLALHYVTSGNISNALRFSRRASAAVIAHALAEVGNAEEQRTDYFRNHIATLALAAGKGIGAGPALGVEGFDIAQWASQSSAAAALQQTAARFASGSGALATLVRESQDLAAQRNAEDKLLIAALSKSDGQQDGAAIGRVRRNIAEIEGRLAAISARLEKEFPDYAALARPQPLKVEDAQKLLGPDEALVFVLANDKESYVFALTREDFVWKTISLRAQELSEKVTAFRRGLDVEALGRGLARVECTQAEADKRGLSRTECDQTLANECAQAVVDGRGLVRIECVQAADPRYECTAAEADKRGLSRTECDQALGKECAQAGVDGRGLVRLECVQAAERRNRLFDLEVAHELYDTLIGPVEASVKDKRHLLVVPSGALTALPFHLLVTEKPVAAVSASKDPKDLALYRDAAWLLKRQAITVLPSVASLKALRVLGRTDQSGKPMVGFGDPVFDPDELKMPAGQRTASRTGALTRGYTEFWQGVEGDRAKLSSLPRLADTADELKAIAKNLGVAASDIHLRADASVTTVKRAPLADYRIVYFATHGLVAGDVKGLAEPSLALTIPRQPNDFDDGLLTASEVAQLKLNADWVVLSACNTIAGDKPEAEALSGLARAFFYAGARALLVSHWSVDSAAATRLTTTTFENLKTDPTIGRAEALRRAMLAYLNDASNPRNAYPAYWAPFELVGEGR
jgi:CHAT domain-containing protein/tetratricopeptide (TPR) repeat protein